MCIGCSPRRACCCSLASGLISQIYISKMPDLCCLLADVTTTLDPEVVQRMWHKRRENRHHGTNLGTTLPSTWSLRLWPLKRNCQLQVCSNRLQVNNGFNQSEEGEQKRNVSSCRHTLSSMLVACQHEETACTEAQRAHSSSSVTVSHNTRVYRHLSQKKQAPASSIVVRTLR